VTRAQTQLLEAQASSHTADAAANSSHEEKAAIALALAAARYTPLLSSLTPLDRHQIAYLQTHADISHVCIPGLHTI